MFNAVSELKDCSRSSQLKSGVVSRKRWKIIHGYTDH